ncbi:MAG: hypothetical protein GC162_18175 [Planctomycetes bacterium]|nr:hypothetical protein [Planctomycetota bacterium]
MSLIARSANAETFDDLEITQQSYPAGDTEHSYAEYAFTVVNHSAKSSHEVTLFAPREQGYNAGLYRMSRTVTVAAGATVHVSLLQPPLAITGNSVGVTIDGRVSRKTLHGGGFSHMDSASYAGIYGYGGYGGGGSPVTMEFFISNTMNQTDLERSYDAAYPAPASGYSGYGRHSGSTREFIRSDVPTSAWGDQWLAYSRFDAVMVTAPEMSKLTQPAFNALQNYVEVGGSLIVVGDYTPPADWRSTPVRLNAGNTRYFLGFGVVQVIAGDNPGKWNISQWSAVTQIASASAAPYAGVMTVSDANKAMPVIENIGVPVRGLFVLMLLFAVLIGPVNLVVLSRMKRRIWLLWTVPAISFVACAAVFTYNFLAEGWTPHRRAQTITILDQRTHRAATIGWTAFYAPIAPGDGLHFSYDTELIPQIRSANYNEGGQLRGIDWTTDQHLESGWVTSRVPAHFRLRKPHLERQRIAVAVEPDGTLTATNGFTADLRRFYYVHTDGKAYAAEHVAAGAKMNLEPSKMKIASTPESRRMIFGSNWLDSEILYNGENETVPMLGQGEYLAVLDNAIFLEPGLEGAAVRPSTSLVYGITELAPR